MTKLLWLCELDAPGIARNKIRFASIDGDHSTGCQSVPGGLLVGCSLLDRCLCLPHHGLPRLAATWRRIRICPAWYIFRSMRSTRRRSGRRALAR